MKKAIALSAILVFFVSNSFSQINRYFKPAETEFINTYAPVPFEQLQAVGRQYKTIHDSNEQKIDALIDWVLDMKSQSSDLQVQNKMDFFYEKLRAFDGEPLTQTSVANRIRNVELEIKKYVADYNAKLRTNTSNTQQTSEVHNHTSNTKGYLYTSKTKTQASLKEQPDSDAKTIFDCEPNTVVYVIEGASQKYLKVSIWDTIGYITRDAVN